MYARITTYPRTALRDARERCQASSVGSLPGVTAQRGCRGTLVLSDPMSGRVQTLSFWDSDDSLIASNRLHRSESRRIARAAGLSGSGAVTQIFEVVDADVAMHAPSRWASVRAAGRSASTWWGEFKGKDLRIDRDAGHFKVVSATATG